MSSVSNRGPYCFCKVSFDILFFFFFFCYTKCFKNQMLKNVSKDFHESFTDRIQYPKLCTSFHVWRVISIRQCRSISFFFKDFCPANTVIGKRIHRWRRNAFDVVNSSQLFLYPVIYRKHIGFGISSLPINMSYF